MTIRMTRDEAKADVKSRVEYYGYTVDKVTISANKEYATVVFDPNGYGIPDHINDYCKDRKDGKKQYTYWFRDNVKIS